MVAYLALSRSIAAIILATCMLASSYKINSFRRPNIVGRISQLRSIGILSKKFLIGGFIAAGIAASGSPAFADLPDEDPVASGPRIIMVTTTTTEDADPVDKPKKKVVSNADDDDQSYSNSLKKEQAKQDARKKSKTARAKVFANPLVADVSQLL
jgi:hypothetical protein